jgi:hypothetical protein
MSRKTTKPKKKEAKTGVASVVEAKSNIGRPTLYRPEYAEQQMKLLMLGATDQDLADFFGVSKQTIYDWRLKHKEFSDSVMDGRQKADMEVAFSAFERAKGKEYFEEVPTKVKRITYDDKGKKISEHEEVIITRVRKFIPPDPTTIQFWLKNRKQVAWRDRKEVEIGKPGDFANMQDEDLLRYIQEEAIELSRGLGGKPDESPGRVVAKGSDSRH